MAKRRMISKDIFMTQEFMSMSLSAQALYSWLVLLAFKTPGCAGGQNFSVIMTK